MKKSKELSEFIHKSRVNSGYRNIRDLWVEITESQKKSEKKWITYQYFQQIESTGRIPAIEDFLIITNFLKIDEMLAVYTYCKAIMPKEKQKAYFDRLIAPMTQAPFTLPTASDRGEIDMAYELSSREVEYLSKNPEAYDVLLTISETVYRTVEEISSVLGISKAKAKKYLEDLLGFGMISKTENQYRPVKKTIRISGNQQNKSLQWSLFQRHLKHGHFEFYNTKNQRPKFRDSHIIPLTEMRAEMVINELRKMTKNVDSLEMDPSDDTSAYYLGIVFAPRFLDEEVKNEKVKTHEN